MNRILQVAGVAVAKVPMPHYQVVARGGCTLIGELEGVADKRLPGKIGNRRLCNIYQCGFRYGTAVFIIYGQIDNHVAPCIVNVGNILTCSGITVTEIPLP